MLNYIYQDLFEGVLFRKIALLIQTDAEDQKKHVFVHVHNSHRKSTRTG